MSNNSFPMTHTYLEQFYMMKNKDKSYMNKELKK